MKRLFAVIVLALTSLSFHSQAGAAEGRVTELSPPALDASRVSRYAPTAKDAQSTLTPQQAADGAKAHVAAQNSGKTAGKTARPAIVESSTHASHIYIYDVGRALIADRDSDGYYSELRIRFDADSNFGDTRVYARLYLRRAGESEWLLYHTTDDFWIHGNSGDDDYYVTTTLDDGFATGDYDVLIDLYESGYSGVVDTIGPGDSSALSYLPLEEVGLDVPVAIAGYSIRDLSTTLLIDSDRDGHYSQFRIAFDPDADLDSRHAYARVWVRPQGGEWIEEHVSADFLVDTSGTADVYGFTADWISGYPTSYYDVQIDLHDAATGLLIASAGSERSELSRIPLEDADRDRYLSPPVTGGGGDTTSRERGGGGAMTAWWALALLLLTIGRGQSSLRPRT